MNTCNHPLFFLFGCARSGTTSLCNILNMANNAVCLCEPAPQLHKETRLQWSGELPNAVESLKTALLPRIDANLPNVHFYGEKNVTLGIFAKELVENFPCKLVFITRDGRDCVNSMRNWHACMFGNLYREGKNQPQLRPRAKHIIENLPVEKDLSDYGRPRPLPGDPYYETWNTLTHHQMLCWYWNAWNMRLIDELEKIDPKRYMRIDYSSPDLSRQIIDLCTFLGLTGVAPDSINSTLSKKVNSVRERTKEDALCCPTWRNWTDEELEQFWEICTPAMRRLGYFTPPTTYEKRWTPDYGKWWMSKEVSHSFFENIYFDRIYQHEAFYNWCKPHLLDGEIKNILEIGCGHGIGYADFFREVYFTGMDISPKEIAWCKANLKNEKHKWICGDFTREETFSKYDLVLCQGTIENMYDMDALIAKMCAASKKYVWLAGWYGFHDDINGHQYIWNETYKSYSNIFSIKQAQKIFSKNGFECLQVKKVITNKPHNPYESIILAKRVKK